jgi:hypothetical protein
MQEFTGPLADAVVLFEEVTHQVIADAQKDPNAVSAAAVEYLDLFAYIMYGYVWARMARVALAQVGNDGDGFYAAKLHTARFYMQRCLPRIATLCETICAGPATLMELSAEQFVF